MSFFLLPLCYTHLFLPLGSLTVVPLSPSWSNLATLHNGHNPFGPVPPLQWVGHGVIAKKAISREEKKVHWIDIDKVTRRGRCRNVSSTDLCYSVQSAGKSAGHVLFAYFSLSAHQTLGQVEKGNKCGKGLFSPVLGT